MNYILYYKTPYYSGILIYDSIYGHSVSTHGLFLSFCLSTLCTYSLIVYSQLITFLCINLIWFIYCIIITNYYFIMYYCSDSFCTVYTVICWQVLYQLWWIAGILNKLLWLWLLWFQKNVLYPPSGWENNVLVEAKMAVWLALSV